MDICDRCLMKDKYEEEKPRALKRIYKRNEEDHDVIDFLAVDKDTQYSDQVSCTKFLTAISKTRMGAPKRNAR